MLRERAPTPAAMWVLLAVLAVSHNGSALHTKSEALQELLIYTDTQGRRFNMSSQPDEGRQTPWPTVRLENGITVQDALTEEVVRKDTHPSAPQLRLHRYEGETVSLSSGVGQWAHPREITWSRDRHLLWHHRPNRPDWKDFREESKLSINSRYDMELQRVTGRDTGVYRANFQLLEGGPVYTMETHLWVHRLPTPRIYTDRTDPGARRLILETNDTVVEVSCKTSGVARRGTTLGWMKDGIIEPATQMKGIGEVVTARIEVTKQDDGALMTCFATHEDTAQRRTASIRIRDRAKLDQLRSRQPRREDTPTEIPEGKDKLPTSTLTPTILAAVALAASALGGAGLLIHKCRYGQSSGNQGGTAGGHTYMRVSLPLPPTP